jgi:transcriptional regulator with XRE-family HTH domain
MEIENIIKRIKLNRKHGLVKKVSEATGISQPTVRKYLKGEGIVSEKALVVLRHALKEVEDAN